MEDTKLDSSVSNTAANDSRELDHQKRTKITEKRREDSETDEEYDREGVRMGEGEEEKDGEDDAEEKDGVDGERLFELNEVKDF
ncbi:hypothetical protein PAAG_00790 [Paracoccidioides lutzii Pb01]|uniref:Uncharacterized protein n=1 Tax=Paracoccidioides lutzii (strain ATCC MYA-826 / Pb01) TaxID=502779 RepID=C1GQJ5_PARBA|nr:hypothetical protein PAAG_00790 [Paracoccidioides lutzii Pb01]EEH37869.2 hypothetical protein PAAG_00790 [Paracoccidioides lutzii Pb01]